MKQVKMFMKPIDKSDTICIKCGKNISWEERAIAHVRRDGAVRKTKVCMSCASLIGIKFNLKRKMKSLSFEEAAKLVDQKEKIALAYREVFDILFNNL